MIGYMRNDINVDGGCFVGKNDPQSFPILYAVCHLYLKTLEEIYPRTLEEQFAAEWNFRKRGGKNGGRVPQPMGNG